MWFMSHPIEKKQVYYDMKMDGGRWTTALLNSPYSASPMPTFYEATNENNVKVIMENLNNFDQLLCLNHWDSLDGRLKFRLFLVCDFQFFGYSFSQG
jgi:hypothetical protein